MNSNEKTQISFEDAILFWRESFVKNPVLKMTINDGHHIAEQMAQTWKNANVSMEDLKEDFLPSTNPNHKPKDWCKVLERRLEEFGGEHPVDEIMPHLLVQSTRKYFESKSIFDEAAILTEEKERVEESDSRIVFVRRPRDIMDVSYTLKKYFPKHGYLLEMKNCIKLVYGRNAIKDFDLRNFETKRNPPIWLPTREKITILVNPPDPQFQYDFMLGGELIETQLVIYNFMNLASDMRLHKELGTLFPSLKDYEEVKTLNRINLTFENSKEALIAFNVSKNAKLCEWKINTVFARKKSSPNKAGGDRKRRRSRSFSFERFSPRPQKSSRMSHRRR